MTQEVQSSFLDLLGEAEEARKRKVSREELIMTALQAVLPSLVEALEDTLAPCLGLNVTRRDDGGFLAILKRDLETQEQVMMAFGDDFPSALRKLNHSLNVKEWRKNKTWKERQAELKAEKSKKAK